MKDERKAIFMRYSKEVIIDYFLKEYFFNVDVKKLEALKKKHQEKKLMDEWDDIQEQTKTLDLKTKEGRNTYWEYQDRIKKIMEKLGLTT